MPRAQAKKPWTWLDTETTGLFPHKGARVLQVAVQITDDALRPWTRHNRTKYATDIRLPEDAMAVASPSALRVNGFARRWTVLELRDCPEETRPYLACGRIVDLAGTVRGVGTEMTNEMIDLVEAGRYTHGFVDKKDEAPIGTYAWVMDDPKRYFDAPPPEAVWPIVHSMLSGCHLVCQNVPFDKPFIEAELHGLGLTYPCERRHIEMMSLSNLVAQHLGTPVWGLEVLYDTMVEKFGLPPVEAHRAEGDIFRMMQVYRFAREHFFRGVGVGGCSRVAELEARVAELEEEIAKIKSATGWVPPFPPGDNGHGAAFDLPPSRL